jgi:hypothetical protein
MFGADPSVEALLTLGRGQLLGISGAEWRDAFAAFVANAREQAVPFTAVETDREQFAELAAGMASGSPPLWLVGWKDAPLPAHLAPLLAAAEQLARRGGGVILGMDAFPPEFRAELSRILEFPLQPGTGERIPFLFDDQGMPVNFLRQGDWGGLFFPLALPDFSEFRRVRLAVTGSGVDWSGEVSGLELWRRFVPQPTGCHAACRFSWPPGTYTASLLLERGGGKAHRVPPVAFILRPVEPAPAPESGSADAGPAIQWRFTGLPSVARPAAALSLRLPPRSRLQLSDRDRDYLLYGWHESEAAGPKNCRRWTMCEASAVLGGAGQALSLHCYDHRPRAAGRETTRLTLEIDGQMHHEFSWDEAGFHRFQIPWIGDGLSHEVSLRVSPTWSPAQTGGEDQRELGLLVERIQIDRG